MQIANTTIIDTFAEAFGMKYAKLIVTAIDSHWLDAAVNAVSGYACSVIACDAEAGVDRWLTPEQTPDGRPGVSLLFFGTSTEALGKALVKRTGQCLMTCPTTAVFDGLPDQERRIPLGKHLRYFGDGFQKSKKLDSRRFWRIPVMDGEFIVEDSLGVAAGVAGGNFIMQGHDQAEVLAASIKAVQAIQNLPDAIAPFPGGVARSGSKVGSRYTSLFASTNEGFCPSLIGRVQTQLEENVRFAYEIVIDAVDPETIQQAMVQGILAATEFDLIAISAGNYGGKLGKFHFHLHSLLNSHGQPSADHVTHDPPTT